MCPLPRYRATAHRSADSSALITGTAIASGNCTRVRVSVGFHWACSVLTKLPFISTNQNTRIYDSELAFETPVTGQWEIITFSLDQSETRSPVWSSALRLAIGPLGLLDLKAKACKLWQERHYIYIPIKLQPCSIGVNVVAFAWFWWLYSMPHLIKSAYVCFWHEWSDSWLVWFLWSVSNSRFHSVKNFRSSKAKMSNGCVGWT